MAGNNKAAGSGGGLWNKLGSGLKTLVKLGAVYLAAKTVKNVVLDQFAQKQLVSGTIQTAPSEKLSSYANMQMAGYESMNAAANPVNREMPVISAPDTDAAVSLDV